MTRLDAYLVDQGHARSRERAKAALAQGLVRVNGRPARKASAKIAPGDVVLCEGEDHAYVSRGALKLIAGLDAFGVDPAGMVCLDLGASTGGFSQVLLERGAAKVFAVDVGQGQLAPEVAHDPRVVNLEATHSGDLTADHITAMVDLVVCDVSFIGLRKALPKPLSFCRDGARLLTLVKPQFEVGRANIGKGGIVKLSPDALATFAEVKIVPWLGTLGWTTEGLIDSPLEGGDGNREFLLMARHA